MAETGFPTVAEELNRKVINSLVNLHSQHERGEVTKREVYVATQALHEAVSGLISRDVLELISMSEVR